MDFKAFMLEIVSVAKKLPLLGKILLCTSLGILPLVIYPPVEDPVFDRYEYNSVVEREGDLCFYLGGRMVAQEDVPGSYYNDDCVPMEGDNVIFIKLKNHGNRIFIGKQHHNEPFNKYMDDIKDALRGDKRGKFLGLFALSLGGCLVSYPSTMRKIMQFISKLLGKIKW